MPDVNGLSFKMYMPFEKQVDDSGSLALFGGIASSSSIDRDNERIDSSCLGKMAQDLMKNPTVFFNHDHNGLAVGKVKSASVEDDKLYVTVEPTKAKGMNDVVTQIEEGLLRSFSIGGNIKKFRTDVDKETGKRYKLIQDVDLFEVSVVGVPANPEATISSYVAKSFDGYNTGEENMDEELSAKLASVKDEMEKKYASEIESLKKELESLKEAKAEEKGCGPKDKKSEEGELSKENGPDTPNKPKLGDGSEELSYGDMKKAISTMSEEISAMRKSMAGPRGLSGQFSSGSKPASSGPVTMEKMFKANFGIYE